MLLGSHSTPTPCCRTICLSLPVKNTENHNNSKSTCHTKFWHSALQLAYHKTYLCRFSSLFKYFVPVQIDVFSFFCQGELSKQPKILNFVGLTGKNDQVNWMSVSTDLGHQMPLWGIHQSTWPDVVPLLPTRCLYLGGTSDWRSAWPKG